MLGAGTPLLPRRLLAPDLTLTAVQHDGQFAFLTYRMADKKTAVDLLPLYEAHLFMHVR
jgi:hypothetical protein